MRMNVNPTRMELLNIKRKLVLAKRGHRLLKDKQDELVKNFKELLTGVKDQRKATKDILGKSFGSFLVTKSSSFAYELDTALAVPWKECKINIKSGSIVGLPVPELNVIIEPEHKDFDFSYQNLSKEYPRTLTLYVELIQSMVKLGELEVKLNLLGLEIEKTRRRVNALEYQMIPNLEETVKYISGKIEEADRESIVRIMKIRDVVRKH